MDKQNVVGPYNGISFSHKKELKNLLKMFCPGKKNVMSSFYQDNFFSPFLKQIMTGYGKVDRYYITIRHLYYLSVCLYLVVFLRLCLLD